MSKTGDDVDYIVFDLETTGLNPRIAEIVEISAVQVKDNEIINQFSSLIKPKSRIPFAATKVNSITNEMLTGASPASVIMPQFFSFIGKSKLVGYNILTFDLPIVRRYAEEFGISLDNPFEDVYPMAVDRVPKLPNNKLTTIANFLLVDSTNAHRALADCLITKNCYEKLQGMPLIPREKSESKKYKTTYTKQTQSLQQLQSLLIGVVHDGVLAKEEVMFLNNWLSDNQDLCGNYPFDRVEKIVNEVLLDGIIEPSELDEMLKLFQEFIAPQTSPIQSLEEFSLSGKNIVISGDFDFGSRPVITELLTKNGGIVKGSVSSKTHIVIVGAKGSADWSCGNYGSKIKRAMELQELGNDIKIITEADMFYLLSL